MKNSISLMVAPLVIFLSACSTHYSASSHHHGYRHHGSHVSVGLHGHHYGRGSNVLGALIVGGVIGHLLTEASHEQPQTVTTSVSRSVVSDDDELINGYDVEAEVNDEQNRWYQSDKNDHCYLMEKVDGQTKIISMVSKTLCD